MHGINLPGHTQEEQEIAPELTVICPSLWFFVSPATAAREEEIRSAVLESSCLQSMLLDNSAHTLNGSFIKVLECSYFLFTSPDAAADSTQSATKH